MTTKITIIGAGNVAWHLAIALETAGHSIECIYSRSLVNAKKISDLLYNCRATTSLDFSENKSELFILAVSDDAIKFLSELIVLPKESVLVHTSGAKELKALNPKDPSIFTGVFYPLMTLSYGHKISFKTVPLGVESDNEEVASWLVEIARTLSENILLLSSRDRLALHVAAVMSCNFTNHLWALSKEILELENLDFSLLKPLVLETVNKAFVAEHPADVQTGPAIREDKQTLTQHHSYLKENKDILKLYKRLSKNIQEWHND